MESPLFKNADHVYAPGEHALDRRGRPVPGYTLAGDAVYDRARVRDFPLRLKEWDFYQIADERYCLQLVIGHVSYAGNCNIALFDQVTGERIFERGAVTPLPLRSMRLPESARADSLLAFSHQGVFLSFETKDGVRKLIARCEGFSAEVTLLPETMKSVLVCMPFSRRNEFYLNEKCNLFRAEVSIRCENRDVPFDAGRTFALLDWGRGVWPVRHEWYWSSVNALYRGAPFGFNLGCGFGAREHARGTENAVYVGNETLKLGYVSISHEADFLQPWRLCSEDGRFSAVLTPRCERDTVTKLLFVNNRCHQMFGTFTGSVVRSGGETVEFFDVPGFAEHAVNRW